MGATASGHTGHEGQADQDHRHHGVGSEFEGVLGLLAGLSMAFGRGRSARLVAELAEVGPGDRVVDVGCGPGRFLREAAERGATAVGVEPSAQMRRLATWRTPAGLRDAAARVVPGEAVVARVVVVQGQADLLQVVRALRPPGRLPRRLHGRQ